jgi:hypothetical protein
VCRGLATLRDPVASQRNRSSAYNA